jgi:hypothetical protein
MSTNKYRVVPMTIEEQDGDGLAVTQVRHAADEDAVEFWAVQQREDGRWYTVDDFHSLSDAEEFLQQLIDGDE